MNKKNKIIGAVLVAAALLSPGIASATFLLDTGTPNGTGGPLLLNSSQWVAAEFAATAGQEITSFSAYLTEGVGQPGDTFTFDIYSSSGFTGRSSGRVLLKSFTGTYTADGWNTTAVNWTPTASDDYWLALQVSSSTQTSGLDLPLEASQATGTAPALGFAILGSGTSGQYKLTTTQAFGVEVSTSPVPLPAAFWLLGSGLLGLGSVARRRSGVPQADANGQRDQS
jgi:hypothetical protein